MMRKIVTCLLGLLWLTGLQAEPWNELSKTQLQRGAYFFMNYCAGCHALRYVRYDRMLSDLGLTQLDGYSVLNAQDLMRVSMPEQNARQWFGQFPPDLSLSARERGPEWLSAYLNGFYADAHRPFGVNNVLIPNVAMPNSLAPLHATMTPQQFEKAIQDVVAFLAYVAEPVKLVRYRMGVVVIIFLIISWFFAYQLKRFYWRN